MINSRDADAVEGIRELTGGFGADVVIEAIGRPETYKQAFYARDLAGTVVLVGVPTPDMQLELPLLDVFGRGGALKSSWYGDCLPSRDFPMLVDLHLRRAAAAGEVRLRDDRPRRRRGGVRQDGARRGAAQRGGLLNAGRLRGDSTAAVRIAMWSGPRTVSTALMRAWENRPDTVVVDEPLYAFYLSATGLDHPGAGRGDRQPAGCLAGGAVVAGRRSAACRGDDLLRQAHDAPPAAVGGSCRVRAVRHAFLIRDPRSLLASYARVRSEPTLADLGLRQQAEIFEEFGGPVIDSADVLAAPEDALRALCSALGVPFSAAMLSWPAGPRPSDGVWAPHWYDERLAVDRFRPGQRPVPPPGPGPVA